jgi:hypothetical protein
VIFDRFFLLKINVNLGKNTY